MTPKYALLEIERRWLVGDASATTDAPPVLITDKYIHGARLRLRRMDMPEGGRIFKFCKKYGDRQGPAEAITNLYLNADEHALLDRLPGTCVTKRRFRLSPGAIDVYGDADDQLRVYEIEFNSLAAAEAFAPPPFVVQEITEDAEFSGLALAQRFGR